MKRLCSILFLAGALLLPTLSQAQDSGLAETGAKAAYCQKALQFTREHPDASENLVLLKAYLDKNAMALDAQALDASAQKAEADHRACLDATAACTSKTTDSSKTPAMIDIRANEQCLADIPECTRVRSCSKVDFLPLAKK